MAVSEAMRISPIHAMPVPPPMHQPSMAVITGFSSVSIRSTTSRPITRSMRASCSDDRHCADGALMRNVNRPGHPTSPF
ncbi:Uncharacterised protein [Bordetella pertussis]|nr:Uncharacterised protein [Bordetella pertussis]